LHSLCERQARKCIGNAIAVTTDRRRKHALKNALCKFLASRACCDAGFRKSCRERLAIETQRDIDATLCFVDASFDEIDDRKRTMRFCKSIIEIVGDLEASTTRRHIVCQQMRPTGSYPASDVGLEQFRAAFHLGCSNSRIARCEVDQTFSKQ